MQEVVANLDHVKFDLEYAIERQLGVQPLPFTGMDKSVAPVCQFFIINACQRGANCPFRHISGNKAVVCKHWLRGLCKKGDQCEFLHEYDMSKMPECYFYARFGRCDNKDCQYQHIDPADKIKDCPWYDRGFCKHGALCKHRHRRKIMCMNYLVGFCPEGKKCKFAHPTWELPVDTNKTIPQCHRCLEYGHKSNVCPLVNPHQNMMHTQKKPAPLPNSSSVQQLVDQIVTQGKVDQLTKQLQQRPPQPATTFIQTNGNKDFSHITCYRCHQKGHYANRCPDIFPPMVLQKLQMQEQQVG